MANPTYAYAPDYAVPPGWVLDEHLEARGISQAEFARRCGRSPKLISEIIAGKARLEPKTALQFERVLGLDASIWLGIESKYQIYRMREAEAASAKAHRAWIKRFPVKDLVNWGCCKKPHSDAESLSELLTFFAVGSVEACNEKFARAKVAYRHSPSFESDEAMVATWLRLGELKAKRQDCANFDKTEFRRAMRTVRSLTREPIGVALERAQTITNAVGVALAIVKPLPRVALSGAAWWPSPQKAVIQLSARYKSDDHLWFSFFHEAAHILLHSKRCIFIEGKDNDQDDLEREANAWAANKLIAKGDWERFAATCPHSASAVNEFADQQGIAPGIIVGRLQHAGFLPYSQLNYLKVRYKWQDD